MVKAQKPDSPPIIKDNFPQLRDNINLKGQEIIKYISKTLPCKPGVYQMENEDGKILSEEIFLEQKKRIYNAFKNSDSDSVIKFKNVLKKIINE